MTRHLSDAIEAALVGLEDDEKAMIDRTVLMIEAHDGAVYGFDLFANGAVNRSLALSVGFRMLIRDRNLICAGALLRLQLDTALRFFAGYIVKNPHEFAIEVLKGKQIRNLRDQDGQLMTDRYLLSQLGKEFEWIEPVYEKTSSYVHLSDTHISSTFDGVNPKNGSWRIKIGWRDKDLADSVYLEAIAAFRESTKVLGQYIDGWVFTKQNPEKIAEIKAARGGK